MAELAAVSAGRPLTDLLPTLVFWGTAVVLGRVLHQRSQDADAAEPAPRRPARGHRGGRRRADGSRGRLHDVVAHSLGVVVLHRRVSSDG